MFGRFRNSKPGCTVSAAAHPDLLPPDLLHSVLTDDLELVSGGCWTAEPSRVFPPRQTPTISKSVQKQHMSWEEVDKRWRLLEQHMDDRFEQSTEFTRDDPKPCSSRATASSYGAALCSRSSSVSQSDSYTSPSSDSCSHSRFGHTSSGTLEDLFDTYMDAGCDEKYLEQHSHVAAEQSRMADNKALLRIQAAFGLQPGLQSRDAVLLSRTKSDDREHGTHSKTKKHDRRLHYPAPSNTSTFAHISTDTLPTIASSAVLGPDLMPKIARDQIERENKLGDTTSTAGSMFSVEVDEIVGGQYRHHEKRVREHVLRDTWSKARSRLGRRSHRASR